MSMDISQELHQAVVNAYENNQPLRIVGGNSKSFYGRTVDAEMLSIAGHQGILNYEPTELTITARAGTPLAEIEKVLDENGQMLGFEPPAFAPGASIGGTIACNFSGPRRATAGAARDFLLGCKLLNGKGEMLSFGGEVMKNVAGYDVSRLMAGAMGTLGILLEVSLKVLPKPEVEETLEFHLAATEALRLMNRIAQTPTPVSASYFYNGVLRLRLSGTETGIKAAMQKLGGEQLSQTQVFWNELKEQQPGFFQSNKPLWRLSLASDVEALSLEGEWLYEWGGALRWLASEADANVIQSTAAEFDGHATLFRSASGESLFQSLSPALLRLHKNLKQAFDPKHILNPGKMYAEI
ncbi:MAG: glycolate oxidase subunit GlcE [Gammaproteobacteria bacterium]|nr:glycolate oxidase subunit GlcE [Gammaproteobacteria bacterium]